MSRYSKKLKTILLLLISLTFLTAMSTADYTRKADPLPNMPEGNPDPNLGIVIHPNSTGIDVLRDSSQAIRFNASANFLKTAIEVLRSSSMRDYTPKKLTFTDERHGFFSNSVFEFSMTFDDKNQQWDYIQFMPFPSVIEWVTEEKLRAYLNQWVKIFEEAGWKRVEYSKSDDPFRIQNFSIPTQKYKHPRQYCSWTTPEYKAVIEVMIRNKENYKYYLPKAERKNIKISPDGYVAYIRIIKKSQYSHL